MYITLHFVLSFVLVVCEQECSSNEVVIPFVEIDMCQYLSDFVFMAIFVFVSSSNG